MDFLTQNIGLISGVSTTGIVLWVLKKVPNSTIASNVEGVFYKLGKVITLGMTSKGSTVKKFWNKTLEPWFIDLLDNIFVSAFKGLVAGLRADK